MESNWSKKWKQLLVWFSAYFHFAAFALVGGYTVVKNEDEELKKTAKEAFIVVLIFAAVKALLALAGHFGAMEDDWYYSNGYDTYTKIDNLVKAAQIVVYAVIMVVVFFRKDKAPAVETNTEEKTEEQK